MTRLVLVVLSLTLLAGCGIKGGLERSDPLWNRDDAIARDCERALREQGTRTGRAPPVDPRCLEQADSTEPAPSATTPQ